MGEVYEAEDLDLGARVGVNTMRVEDENSAPPVRAGDSTRAHGDAS